MTASSPRGAPFDALDLLGPAARWTTHAAFGCSVLALAACGGSAPKPAQVQPKPVASIAPVEPAGPAPLAFAALGTFTQGTFGPRLAHGTTRTIMISAPAEGAGRKWTAAALGRDGRPEPAHELEAAPEVASSWDVKPNGDGFVLAWTRPGATTGEELLTIPLDHDGAPRGSATVVAKNNAAVGIVAVRLIPTKGGGITLTWGEKSLDPTTGAASGALLLTPLDALGRPTGAFVRVAEHLAAWQVIALQAGGIAAAVVEQGAPSAPTVRKKDDPDGDGRSDGARKDPAHKPRKKAEGAAPEAPSPAAHLPNHEARTPRLIVCKPTGGMMAVSERLDLGSSTASNEIDVVETKGGRLLVVFADKREPEARLVAAAVEAPTPGTAKLIGTTRAVAPLHGEQRLTALVATTAGPALLYESSSPRAIEDARRRFSLVRLQDDGTWVPDSGAEFSFPYEGDVPEIAALPQGDEVSILTYGTPCLAPAKQPPTLTSPKATDAGVRPQTADAGAPSLPAVGTCASDLRPYVLRFAGRQLSPVRQELVDVGDALGGPVRHAFDLSCHGATCEVLVEGPTNPATVARVMVPPLAASTDDARPRWTYGEWLAPDRRRPRLLAATALGREIEFSDLRAASNRSGAAVAWLDWDADETSDNDPSAKGEARKRKPKPEPKAHVKLRMLRGLEPTPETWTVTDHALSRGGVALAFADEAERPVVAYVSREGGDEEIFTAFVNASGKAERHRITRVKGSATEPALVALPGARRQERSEEDKGAKDRPAYVLAWADGRKGKPTVWAVRLTIDGRKLGEEVQIGGGGPDIGDVALASVAPNRVLIAWSDTRRDEAHGYADVFAAALTTEPLARIGAEHVVLETALHSHGVSLTSQGDGTAVLGWMEDDPSAAEMLELDARPDWGAYVTRLDSTAMPLGTPTQVQLDATPTAGAKKPGVVTGISVACPSVTSACRVALAVAQRTGISLQVGTFGGAEVPRVRRVWSFHGAPTQEVAPSLVGDALVACEDGHEQNDGRVRLLGLSW